MIMIIFCLYLTRIISSSMKKIYNYLTKIRYLLKEGLLVKTKVNILFKLLLLRWCLVLSNI